MPTEKFNHPFENRTVHTYNKNSNEFLNAFFAKNPIRFIDANGNEYMPPFEYIQATSVEDYFDNVAKVYAQRNPNKNLSILEPMLKSDNWDEYEFESGKTSRLQVVVCKEKFNEINLDNITEKDLEKLSDNPNDKNFAHRYYVDLQDPTMTWHRGYDKDHFMGFAFADPEHFLIAVNNTQPWLLPFLTNKMRLQGPIFMVPKGAMIFHDRRFCTDALDQILYERFQGEVQYKATK